MCIWGKKTDDIYEVTVILQEHHICYKKLKQQWNSLFIYISIERDMRKYREYSDGFRTIN